MGGIPIGLPHCFEHALASGAVGDRDAFVRVRKTATHQKREVHTKRSLNPNIALSVRPTHQHFLLLGMFPIELPEPFHFSALRPGEGQLNFVDEFLDKSDVHDRVQARREQEQCAYRVD